MMTIETAKGLSDKDLLGTLRQSLNSERVEMATSLACLVAIAARDLHVRQGASSLFEFLTRDLHLSQPSASKRAAAVRAISRYPEMLDLVRTGQLHLSNCSLVARHLTDDNRARLIALAQNKTHRDLERLLAVEFSKPITRDSLRPVTCASVRSTGQLVTRAVTQPVTQGATSPDTPTAITDPKPTPLSLFADTGIASAIAPAINIDVGSRVAATLDHESTEALEFLRQAMPGKTLGEILGMALQELRDRRDPERKAIRAAQAKVVHALSQTSASETKTTARRSIPTALRREVARRDQYRCTYVAPDGRRCEARHRLECDHIVPRAFGGEHTFSNLRLQCKAHNLLAAKDAMGKSFIESHFRQPPGQ